MCDEMAKHVVNSCKQDRQYTYNVSLRWKAMSILYCECVCSLRYPAWKAHAQCCVVIWGPLWLDHVFPHCLINGTILGRNTEHKIFFALQLLSERFFILSIYKRDIITNVRRSLYKVPFILVKLNLLKIPLTAAELFHTGQTGRNNRLFFRVKKAISVSNYKIERCNNARLFSDHWPSIFKEHRKW